MRSKGRSKKSQYDRESISTESGCGAIWLSFRRLGLWCDLPDSPNSADLLFAQLLSRLYVSIGLAIVAVDTSVWHVSCASSFADLHDNIESAGWPGRAKAPLCFE